VPLSSPSASSVDIAPAFGALKRFAILLWTSLVAVTANRKSAPSKASTGSSDRETASRVWTL
jgi:hypothetical protein